MEGVNGLCHRLWCESAQTNLFNCHQLVPALPIARFIDGPKAALAQLFDQLVTIAERNLGCKIGREEQGRTTAFTKRRINNVRCFTYCTKKRCGWDHELAPDDALLNSGCANASTR